MHCHTEFYNNSVANKSNASEGIDHGLGLFDDIRFNHNISLTFMSSSWFLLMVQMYCFEVIRGYLKSKPPLSQTVMDPANEMCFGMILLNSLIRTINTTLTTLFADFGHAMTTIWSVAVVASSMSMGMEHIANITVQLLIVKRPSRLENATFEKWIKI